MEKRTRPKQVKFWATEEELEEINKKVKASKLSKQEFLLRSSLNKNVQVIDGLKEVLIELAKEGNNLNLILREIKDENDNVYEDVSELKEKLTNLWNVIDTTLKEGKS